MTATAALVQILLIAATAILVSSSSDSSTPTIALLRGSTGSTGITSTANDLPLPVYQHQQEQQQQEQQQQRHRRLTEETSCKLFLRQIEYEEPPTHDGDDNDNNDDEPRQRQRRHSEESWSCQFSEKDGADLGGVYFVDIVDVPQDVVSRARSGSSTMTVSEAILDTVMFEMYVPKTARVAVRNDDADDDADDTDSRQDVRGTAHRQRQRQRQRHLETPRTGTLNALVVRVSAQDVGPSSTAGQLKNDVFEDPVCLKTQMEKCSYGKLKIAPYVGTTANGKSFNGVLDVKLGYKIADDNSRGRAHNAAFAAALEAVGTFENDKKPYNLVMFCMPPGTGTWVAYADIRGRYSYYNDDWCNPVSTQMHEIGHNLGLAHSAEINQGEYDDREGYMGYSYKIDDQSMCYNAAKNYQLGWYEDKIVDYNPLGKQTRTVVLNGVADYTKNPSAIVAVRLDQPNKVQDYYIGYNRKTGINQDTAEDADKVTILRKELGTPKQYGKSTKVAALSPGMEYTIQGFNGERDVTIKFHAVSNALRDATIVIGENIEKDPCENYAVEVKTDIHPGDNSWTIKEAGTGVVHAISPAFTEKQKLHRSTVCLPFGKKLVFTMVDTYKDGITDPPGYYRMLSPTNQELFRGGSGQFHIEEQTLTTGAAPPTQAPAPVSAPTKKPTNKPTASPPDTAGCASRQTSGKFVVGKNKDGSLKKKTASGSSRRRNATRRSTSCRYGTSARKPARLATSWQKVTKKKKPPLFTARRRKKTGVVVSPGLRDHIVNDASCYSYFTQSSGIVDFASCVFIRKKRKKLEDVSQQLGLTNTRNGPQSSDGALPEVLDNQVMYDPSVESIGRALIGQELSNIDDDNDSVSDDNFFFPNNDDEEEGSEIIEAPHSLIVNDEEGINIDVDDSHRASNTLLITTPNVGRNISDELKVKIKLMKIMRNHSIPLVAEKELYEWAIESERLNLFSWTKGNLIKTRASVMKEISATVPEIKGDGFEPHLIDWCSKKSQNADVSSRKQIYVRSFQKALHSLLTNVTLVKEDNLSFPHAEDPTLPVRYPLLQGNIDIDELHHGEWWINTWEKRCKSGSNEILVPIILYMDGIAIDNSCQTTLTPLNMTLGIFNTLTRNSRPDAWEAIYYHPTCPGDKGAESIDNVNNLHSGLRLALSSLKDACNLTDGIEWSNLPWNKKKWSVRMKFAVAYFIGDTPQHDQLCGHYQTSNSKMICRHCNCPRALGINARVNVLKVPVSLKSGNMQVSKHQNGDEYQSIRLWNISDFTAPIVGEGVNVEQYFKNISHHGVHNGNAFYDLDFGENPHNIHLASPGERLHMHQLGCAKRAAETFREDFLGNNQRLLGEMERLASYYGGAVQRQSDRDFPRTNFSESIHTAKKEGNQYIGMLYIQMLSLLSAGGRQLLLSRKTPSNLENKSRKCEEEIDRRIYAIELLLGMEEFLKYAGTFDEVFKQDKKGVLNVDKMVVLFINCINNNLQRSKGEGNNLIIWSSNWVGLCRE
eukprot:jgi/Psemu1/53707/gm1.53707_g